jgi:hypothetical protein
MAYTQHFGLSRNSPLNMGGGNTSKEIESKVDTNPSEASSIIEQNNKKSWFSKGADYLQDGLSVLGMIPGLGAIPDAINTGISGGRLAYNAATGDKAGMKEAGFNLALNAAAIIPGAGQAATAAKFANKARKSIKGADKALDIYKGIDSAIASNKIVKGIKQVGTKGTSYVKNAQPLLKSDNLIKKGSKSAYNFATQKKGIIPEVLQKGIKNKLGNTAYLASKSLDKSTSAIGITKFGKMGFAGEDVQKNIKSAYTAPKNKNIEKQNKPKNTFGPIPSGVLVSDPKNKNKGFNFSKA